MITLDEARKLAIALDSDGFLKDAEAMRYLAQQVEDLQADAARYRLLRCYEVSGGWPRGVNKCPGILSFSASYNDDRKYSKKRLDDLLDDMLGTKLPADITRVRSDYVEWRKRCTQEAIDEAMK